MMVSSMSTHLLHVRQGIDMSLALSHFKRLELGIQLAEVFRNQVQDTRFQNSDTLPLDFSALCAHTYC
jgi:hypothetical protein